MSATRISVIIPVKPGGEVRALESLTAVDYPEDDFEIVIAEGSQPSRQRNLAAAAASGEILYFLDDDSLLDPHNLLRLQRHFAASSVAAVGGPSLTPEGDGYRQQGFGAALASLFGGGGVRNRYRRRGTVRDTDDRELILCNLGIRAAVFRSLSGFDERLYPNEENEFLGRVRDAGWKILHDPDLVITRSQRGTFRAFVRQLHSYGKGRAEQTLIGGGGGLLTYIPSLFVLYLAILLLFNNPVYYLPLVCYAILLVSFSIFEAAAARRPWLVPGLLVIFPLLHLAYGVGMISGFVAPRFRKPRSVAVPVTLRWEKKLDSAGGQDPAFKAEKAASRERSTTFSN